MVTMFVTTVTIVGSNVGNACEIPCANSVIICTPASKSCGNIVSSVSMIVGIICPIMLIISGSIPTSVLSKSCTPLIKGGNNSCITCGIYVASCSTISPSPLTSLGTVSITLGAIFPTTVIILSTRLLVSCEKFASLSAIPATQLSHAELIELTEPSIVVLASFAVVPVMPISVCTT